MWHQPLQHVITITITSTARLGAVAVVAFTVLVVLLLVRRWVVVLWSGWDCLLLLWLLWLLLLSLWMVVGREGGIVIVSVSPSWNWRQHPYWVEVLFALGMNSAPLMLSQTLLPAMTA